MKIYDNPALQITLPLGPMPGMYETLRAQGALVEGGTNGEFAFPKNPAQNFINAWTAAKSLTWAQNEISNRIDLFAKNLRDAKVSGTSPAEMSTWSIKKSESDAYTAAGGGSAGAAVAPSLVAEALARGVPVANLVTKVQAKVSGFLSTETTIAGVAGKHKDAVAALVDHVAVMAYDYSIGWP